MPIGFSSVCSNAGYKRFCKLLEILEAEEKTEWYNQIKREFEERLAQPKSSHALMREKIET